MMSSWTIDTNKLKQAVAYTHIHMHIWVLYARLETHKSHTSILFFAHSTYYFACLLDCYVVFHKRNAHTHRRYRQNGIFVILLLARCQISFSSFAYIYRTAILFVHDFHFYAYFDCTYV